MKVILLQDVSVVVAPDTAKIFGIKPGKVTYRKGVRDIPEPLVNHWAIKAQTKK